MEKIIKLIKKILPESVYESIQPIYHFLISLAGAIFYRFPSKKLIVIGITGTNGKSTTVYLISKILERAGKKVASLSSIQFRINGEEKPNLLKMTMPGRFFIQKFLRQAVDNGCEYAIVEVTSEGVLQSRHRFIDFDIVAMTNVTKEHLERHGGFENYKAAKGKLFESLSKTKRKGLFKKTSIVNLDDPNADYFLNFSAEQKLVFSLKNEAEPKKTTLIAPKKYEILSEAIKFNFDNVDFTSKLKGEFNLYNILTAIAVGKAIGIEVADMKKAIEESKNIPGRLEEIDSNQPFKTIVDYAHTPDALQKVYETLSLSDKKLICVLGSAGGGRDKWKRSEMGSIASTFCDRIILTNEDPYDEDPEEIIAQVKGGISNDKLSAVNEVLDRREAIKLAVNSASEDDLVIITGKGCEKWMMVEDGKKIPWDDREIAQEELKMVK